MGYIWDFRVQRWTCEITISTWEYFLNHLYLKTHFNAQLHSYLMSVFLLLIWELSCLMFVSRTVSVGVHIRQQSFLCHLGHQLIFQIFFLLQALQVPSIFSPWVLIWMRGKAYLQFSCYCPTPCHPFDMSIILAAILSLKCRKGSCFLLIL